eukprot:366551-Chlamydomonas_euryale.AAC.23
MVTVSAGVRVRGTGSGATKGRCESRCVEDGHQLWHPRRCRGAQGGAQGAVRPYAHASDLAQTGVEGADEQLQPVVREAAGFRYSVEKGWDDVIVSVDYKFCALRTLDSVCTYAAPRKVTGEKPSVPLPHVPHSFSLCHPGRPRSHCAKSPLPTTDHTPCTPPKKTRQPSRLRQDSPPVLAAAATNTSERTTPSASTQAPM